LLTALLSLKRREETDLDQLRELTGKLKEQQSKIEFLKTKEGEILKSELTLKEYEHCLINYKNLFDRSDEIGNRIVRLRKSIENEDLILKES
jgi:hypothetical protein